jgi:ribonucleoside-diphosphate reductase alpha chain
VLVAGALTALSQAHGEGDADTAAGRGIVRGAVAHVLARLGGEQGAARITEADLSALAEAALIDAGQYEVAKALVMPRALPTPRDVAAATTLKLIRRSGDVVAWNPAKIEVAIRKAFLSLQADPEPAAALTRRVSERAQQIRQAYVAIETVQDIVQEELVLGGQMRVAERDIVYRAERALLRAQESGGSEPVAPAVIPVLEADGRETAWDGADVRARIAFATIGLDDIGIDAAALERELWRAIRPGVARTDIRKLVILNAKALVERDSELARFAGRILLTYVYEETLDWDIVRDGVGRLAEAHRRALRPMLERGVQIKRIDAKLPTATIANITRTSPCIEPMYKNLFAKSNLSGDFTVLNPFLVRDLKDAGLWTREIAEEIKARDGDLTEIAAIPQLRERHRTAFQIDAPWLIDAAARRQKWLDQSQSLNLFLPEPDIKAIATCTAAPGGPD